MKSKKQKKQKIIYHQNIHKTYAKHKENINKIQIKLFRCFQNYNNSASFN